MFGPTLAERRVISFDMTRHVLIQAPTRQSIQVEDYGSGRFVLFTIGESLFNDRTNCQAL